jgi:hypothetical protein
MALSEADIQDKVHEGHIHCRCIVELLGAPQEYVEKSMALLLEKLEKQEGITLLKKELTPPEKQEKLYAHFTEVEMLVKDAGTLAFFCFDYMPSSIEILAPQTFTYRAADFTAFFNDLQTRLHKIDAQLKDTLAHNKNLLRNANLLLRNNVMIVLDNQGKQGSLTLSTLSERVGIPEPQLKPFVENLVKEQWVVEGNGEFSLAQQVKKDKKD